MTPKVYARSTALVGVRDRVAQLVKRANTRTAARLGCPLGCEANAPHECALTQPLPIAERGPCTGECGSYGLPERERFARELGCCPCVAEEVSA